MGVQGRRGKMREFKGFKGLFKGSEDFLREFKGLLKGFSMNLRDFKNLLTDFKGFLKGFSMNLKGSEGLLRDFKEFLRDLKRLRSLKCWDLEEFEGFVSFYWCLENYEELIMDFRNLGCLKDFKVNFKVNSDFISFLIFVSFYVFSFSFFYFLQNLCQSNYPSHNYFSLIFMK